MFREMRRIKQRLSQEECNKILREQPDGVLAVLGDEGYPYAVPVNYVYQKNRIIFHSAVSGHKVEAMKNCDKVSFCVVAKRAVVGAELTTYFQSVIAFGKVRRLTEADEIRDAATALGLKFLPDREKVAAEIEGAMSRLACYAIEIEHCTGKEAIELVRARNNPE